MKRAAQATGAIAFERRCGRLSESRSIPKRVLAGGPTVTVVITEYDVDRWRPLAAAQWSEWKNERPETTSIRQDAPGYWIDRIGFRLARATERTSISVAGIVPLECRADGYTEMLSRWAQETPGSAGFPPASWDEPMGLLPFADRIMSAFRALLLRFGLSEYRNNFTLDPHRTWHDFYADSVFYPGPPVFRGGSFIRRFSEGHAQRLLAEEGPRGPLEFSVALTRVHEGLHKLQTGESLFCELIVSMIWSSLLTVTDLWHWQVDPITQQSTHREAQHLVSLNLDDEAIGACVRDAAVGVRELVSDPNWYGVFCAAAWLFDRKECRYDDYLSFVTSALRRPDLPAPKVLDAAAVSRCRNRASTSRFALSRLLAPSLWPNAADSNDRAEPTHGRCINRSRARALAQASEVGDDTARTLRLRDLGTSAIARRYELALTTRRMWGWGLSALVRPFVRRGVRFVVVGGVALSYYTNGKTRPADLDILLDQTAEAASGSYEALLEIIGRGVISGPPEFSSTAIREGLEMTFKTALGTLHLIGRSAGPEAEGIIARRHWVWLDRTRAPLCELADLVALKERDRREKDLLDLQLLHDLGLHRGERPFDPFMEAARAVHESAEAGPGWELEQATRRQGRNVIPATQGSTPLSNGHSGSHRGLSDCE